MINSRIFFTCLFLFSAFSLFAQEIPRKGKIKISDITIMASASDVRGKNPQLNEARNLIMESSLFKDVPPEFQPSVYSWLATVGSFSALVGMKFQDAAGRVKPNIRFRAGLSYCIHGGTSIQTWKEDKRRVDTLTGSTTGIVLYVDSVKQEFYSADYAFNQLRLDASFLLGTNSEKRFSVYTGLGINGGASIIAKTEVAHSIYETTDFQDEDNNDYWIFNNKEMKRTSESETIINKRNIAMSAYVPLGLDFRIGKNNKFFNHIHLFTEFRPTVNVTSVPEMGNFFAYGYQLTSGLKFEIQ